MTSKFKLEGFAELDAKLKELGTDAKTRGKLVRPAMGSAIDVIHDSIEARIPEETGQLKDSLFVTGVKRKRGEFIILTGVDPIPFDKGLAQEFGSDNVRAQPFLLPGFQAAASRALDVLKRNLGISLEIFARTGQFLEYSSRKAASKTRAFRSTTKGLRRALKSGNVKRIAKAQAKYDTARASLQELVGSRTLAPFKRGK